MTCGATATHTAIGHTQALIKKLSFTFSHNKKVIKWTWPGEWPDTHKRGSGWPLDSGLDSLLFNFNTRTLFLFKLCSFYIILDYTSFFRSLELFVRASGHHSVFATNIKNIHTHTHTLGQWGRKIKPLNGLDAKIKTWKSENNEEYQLKSREVKTPLKSNTYTHSCTVSRWLKKEKQWKQRQLLPTQSSLLIFFWV